MVCVWGGGGGDVSWRRRRTLESKRDAVNCRDAGEGAKRRSWRGPDASKAGAARQQCSARATARGRRGRHVLGRRAAGSMLGPGGGRKRMESAKNSCSTLSRLTAAGAAAVARLLRRRRRRGRQLRAAAVGAGQPQHGCQRVVQPALIQGHQLRPAAEKLGGAVRLGELCQRRSKPLHSSSSSASVVGRRAAGATGAAACCCCVALGSTLARALLQNLLLLFVAPAGSPPELRRAQVGKETALGLRKVT